MLRIGVLGLSWFLEEAALTQAGFSGNDRYLIAAAAVIVVLGAVAWAGALSWVGMRLMRLGRTNAQECWPRWRCLPRGCCWSPVRTADHC